MSCNDDREMDYDASDLGIYLLSAVDLNQRDKMKIGAAVNLRKEFRRGSAIASPIPVATGHLPFFITAPGDTDVLFNIMVVF